MSNATRVEAFGPQIPDAEIAYYQQRDIAKPKDKFYASGVMDCARKQVYEILQAAESNTAKHDSMVLGYRRAAALGDIIHALLQDWAVAAGKVKMLPAFSRDHKSMPDDSKPMPAIEVPVDRYTIEPEKYDIWRSHRMGGKCDGILTGSGEQDYIWEIKTVDTKYLTIPKYQQYFPAKLIHYEEQCQWYMWAFGIEQALILVIDRNRFMERFTGSVNWPWEAVYQEFHVTYNPMFMERELNRVGLMVENLEKGTLPEGERHRGPCPFCTEYTCEFNPNRKAKKEAQV